MPNLSLRSKDSQAFPSREPSDRARRHLPTNRSARATDHLSAYHPPSVAASPKSPSIPLTPYSSRIPLSTPIPRSPVLSSRDAPSANVSFQHSRPISTHSAPVQDILLPGDIIGQGLNFQGERVRLLPISASHHTGDDDLNAPSIKFEVVKALGTGSYAVVYQVRQILSGYPPTTEDLSPISAVDFDGISCPAPVGYGREYALKCLSKADLDKDALSAQMFEVRAFLFPCLTPSAQLSPPGNDSPISAYPSERRHALSHPRNALLPPSTSRIRSRPGPLLFFGTVMRSLRTLTPVLSFPH